MDDVVIVPADPAWPSMFDKARADVSRVLGARAVGIEHIGSTAVAGLPAKPVIDILCGMESIGAADAALPDLEKAGWVIGHEINAKLTDRRFLLKRGASGERTHHLHLVAYGGTEWISLVSFRDRLRSDPEMRERYAELKKSLAEKHSKEREVYTSSKSGFVHDALTIAPPPNSHKGH